MIHCLSMNEKDNLCFDGRIIFDSKINVQLMHNIKIFTEQIRAIKSDYNLGIMLGSYISTRVCRKSFEIISGFIIIQNRMIND